MPHSAAGPAGAVEAPAASPAAVLAMAGLVALACMATTARGADPDPRPAANATVTIAASPPTILIAAAETAPKDANQSTDTVRPGKRGTARITIDDDEDFVAVTEKMPWVIGLIFLVVGSIFLTPVVLLVGIIWYKLRKARLQNEAMLALAEKGVVPPAQAAEAIAAGAPPANAAPQVYQQAVALRKRVVWSDLRKGIIMCMAGLGLSLYSLTAHGGANWLGLVLTFVGLGYIAVWWLEGRQPEGTAAAGRNNGARPGGG